MAVFPLSYGQERIWFMDRMAPGNALFNLNNAFRFRMPLVPAVLERSVNEVVRRHEALRTIFRPLADQPMQVVLPELRIPLPVVDLQGVPPGEREAAIETLVRQDATEPFDLEHGPLIRTRLLRLADSDYVFSLTLHHIVSDGWSLGVFLHELSSIWRAFAEGRPANLPELGVQYGDYAVWQRDWLEGEALERQLAYWREQLRDLPQLDLATDRPRPAVPTHVGGVCPLELSPELTSRVEALSRSEGVTPFMTLLSAFQVLLHRYTGQEDIPVGSYIAGRNQAEVEPLIGFFLNTLVLRTPLDGELSFREVLGRVRRMTLDAYAHQDIPFAKLVAELEPERDLSRSPLVQVVFQVINVPTLVEGDGRTELVEVDKGTAIFDLTCTLWESGAGMRGHLEYSADLFEPATVERMASHLQVLLEAALADPDAPVGRLRLLPEAERRLVVEDWNATDVAHEDDRGLAALWAEQAALHPAATAFACGGDVLTYEELDRRSEALARRLRARIGGEPEPLVGICLERGLDVPVALIAVLKAGAAFLPLDPAYPPRRLALMVGDAKASVVITAPHLRGLLPDASEVVLVDDDGAAPGGGAVAAPAVDPDALAYVIFTSGSTGRPKGVAVPHRQVLNRLRWMWREYPFRDGEVCCQKTAISFVDAIWELLGGLLQGVPTAILPDSVLVDPEALVDTLAEHRVSRLWVVPSFLRMLLDGVDGLGTRVPDLRFWVTTGEPIASELAERFTQAVPHAVLHNVYGTSEVWDATWWDPQREAPARDRVPIGRPIDNVRAYVLDANAQPVPIGIPGELHVAGAGLGRGYLGRPELTEERFVRDPFSEQPDARLYRTGDLARLRRDGCIELLGRQDHQVKIRGFRVEPGEVEATLARHPAVRAPVVTARDTPDGTQLAAYVTVHDGEAPSPAQLRRFMREHVPEHMVPADIVVLDALPMTPSGKLDRTALEAVAGRRRESRPAAAPVAPRTDVERTIVEAWSEVLERDDVGLHDNFFDLGGHSMLLFRVGTRLRRTLGREIPMNDLFRHPTVEALAAWLADADADPGRDRATAARARERARRRQARPRGAPVGRT